MELVIVLVIIGVIGAIAVPRLTRGTSHAARNAFVRDLKVMIRAVELYTFEQGAPPPDSSTGQLPCAAFGEYVVAQSWERDTPLGGQWDTEFKDSGGFTSTVGVHFHRGPARPDADMRVIDAEMDDGDLTTGRFRKTEAGRFYWIVAD